MTEPQLEDKWPDELLEKVAELVNNYDREFDIVYHVAQQIIDLVRRAEITRLRTNDDSAIKYAVAMDEVNDELRAENERLRAALGSALIKAGYSPHQLESEIRAALGTSVRIDD